MDRMIPLSTPGSIAAAELSINLIRYGKRMNEIALMMRPLYSVLNGTWRN